MTIRKNGGPDKADIWGIYQEGRVFIEQGEYDAAIRKLKQVIRVSPAQKRHAWRMGPGFDILRTLRTLLSQPRLPAPLTSTQRLYVEASLSLAYCYVEQIRLDQAIQILLSAISVNPNCADALCELGYIYGLKGEGTQAEAIFRKTIERHPDCARAYKSLGFFCIERDDVENGIALCKQAIRLDPGYEQAYLDLAAAYDKKGNGRQAIAAMKKALRLAPDNPYHHYHLGLLYRSYNNMDKAAGSLLKAISLSPHERIFHESLMEVRLTQGDFGKAVETAQAGLTACPRSPVIMDMLSIACFQCGRLREAIQVLNELVLMNPFEATYHFKLAVLYQHIGDVAHAVYEFGRVVMLDPENEMAEDAADALELLDQYQIQQILLLATDDTAFRLGLMRHLEETLQEKGFYLSPEGLDELGDFLQEIPAFPPLWPTSPLYN
ncbi:MAG: tetratricopeptide repeat protein [Armatimonadetes bacterium]|nr:tetratricopeptide repeat protein [Armatimonadota bacterium]